MFQRVEVEFLSGPDNIKDRRAFEKVKILECIINSHLRVVSVDDGELVVKWDRLGWYHTQPLSQLGMQDTIEQQVLAAGRDINGKLNQKINAIKKHRELTGEGLRESKEYCDRLFDRHSPF